MASPVTYYRPDVLIEAIKRYPFDCVLMAMNAADPHHYSFNDQLLPLAVEKQMGIIGMKIPGRGRILSSWTPPSIDAQKHSWEGMAIQTDKPGTLTMREAMYYTLSRPVSTVIIGCDSIPQLEENVKLAQEFTPLNDKQTAELVARAEACSKPSLFFRFYDRPTDWVKPLQMIDQRCDARRSESVVDIHNAHIRRAGIQHAQQRGNAAQ